MPIYFKKILLPVDFSINTEAALKKTLELIEYSDSAIHLYHVIPKGWFSKEFRKREHQAAYKLDQWRESIQESFEGIDVKTEIGIGSNIRNSIIRKAISIQPDLIVIGKKQYSSFKIAEISNCPVLSVKPESLHSTIKSVVMPVDDFVPRRKLEMIAALKKKFRIRVHLITVLGKRNTQLSANVLFETYRLLKDGLQCPLEYHVLRSRDMETATLEYAEHINADMLLINASRRIEHILKPNSHLQIMALKP